ncbi:RHS repeat domain-containing protein [Pseudomonas sp. microsymbiont 2]
MTALPILLGRQTFDGLGRQRSVQVAGRTTHYHYRPGQLPPTANTLADGTHLAYTYEPQLDNALLSSATPDQPGERLSYHAPLGLPASASNALGEQRWHFTPSGKALRDTWTVDGIEHSTHWRHSLNGLLLGFTDSAGGKHRHQYDAFGRLSVLSVGGVRTTFTYDAWSRPATISTDDPASDRQLVKQLSYDSMGREAACAFKVKQAGKTRSWHQTLVYGPLDQVVSRTWHDGERQGEEHFAYDLRGRLVHYTANAVAAPQDPFGNPIVDQRFTFNALDGLREVVSTFADGSQDHARFSYAAHDPTQVVSISHSHDSWPSRIDLRYDACGRVIGDSLGRRMSWTAHDRLASVSVGARTCHYRYDASGQLCDRILDGELERSWHSAGQLTHVQQAEQRLELIGNGAGLFALSKAADGIRQTILIGCDAQGSARLEVKEQVRSRRYTAHGAEADEGEQPFGYAGLRREPLTGWYIPAGYRPYDPMLMCFLAPDSESPFGRGGINPYAYCAGDPVNRIDPDGHSWVTWALAGVGLALGAAITLASLGTAMPAVAGLFAGGLGSLSASGAWAIGTAALNAVSLGTGVAAMALEASGRDQHSASVLGWISLASGLASLGTGAAARLAAAPARAPQLTRGAGAIRLREPRITRPAYWEQRSEVLYAERAGQNDVAMHYNLWGQGIRAFETHGSKGGQLMNAVGQMDDPARIALKEIAPRLAGVEQNVPLVLLACHGGKSGAAQRIADVLQRPVYGYDKVIWVNRAGFIQSLRVDNFTSSLPSQNISRWKRLQGAKGPFSFYPQREIATGRTYYPR